jgi:hypothetical protein
MFWLAGYLATGAATAAGVVYAILWQDAESSGGGGGGGWPH